MIRVFLIAFEEGIEQALSYLNRDNVEVRGLVTLPTATAAQTAERCGLSQKIYSYADLPQVINNLWFDYLILWGEEDTVAARLRELQVPTAKIIDMRAIRMGHTAIYTSLLRQGYRALPNKKSLVVIGNSHSYAGIDMTVLTVPAISFAFPGQDVFFGVKSSEWAIEHRLRNVAAEAIGISPYFFHYDISLSGKNNWLVLQCAPALGETNNWHIDWPKMQQIFSARLFQTQAAKKFDLGAAYGLRALYAPPLNLSDWLHAHEVAVRGSKKNFPVTTARNRELLLNHIRFLQKREIVPFIVLYPLTDIYWKYFSPRLLDECRCLLSDIVYSAGGHLQVLDYYERPDFDYGDFHDSDHLSASGGRKMTRVIDEFIHTKLDIDWN